MQVYIIAEIGNTHEGSVPLAKSFIKAAADCGVNAVKFQTHIFEFESTPDAPNPPYFDGESRQQYFNRTSFNAKEWSSLKVYAEKTCGVDFISSPFSREACEMLADVGINRLKIASGEVNNVPLLRSIARFGEEVFLSSGMSSVNDIAIAIETLKKINPSIPITLMQCTSKYPCPPENVGLNLIKDFKQKYTGLQIGFSDHSLGVYAPLAAITLGAVVIEKHFTLSKLMYGPDAPNSMEPNELKFLVEQIRQLEVALESHVDKDHQASELQDMKFIFEKSVVASEFIAAETVLTEKNITTKKPSGGISAADFESLIGRKVKCDIARDSRLSWDDLEE